MTNNNGQAHKTNDGWNSTSHQRVLVTTAEKLPLCLQLSQLSKQNSMFIIFFLNESLDDLENILFTTKVLYSLVLLKKRGDYAPFLVRI